uniref:NAD(P)(+)--arginine ADP-ribosyltransferase n=1 Tax=Xenopus tropicalis TaxID=8364 RepID=A4QN93_XENTR
MGSPGAGIMANALLSQMDHLMRIWPIVWLLLQPIITQETLSEAPMDLEEDTFDDQYIGCRDQVDLLMDEILKTEKSKNRLLRRAWTEAENIWNIRRHEIQSELPVGFRDSHGVALVAYSGFIRTYFDEAVVSAGKSYNDYIQRFQYKGLHFYLTVAVQLLSGGCQKRPKLVYLGTNGFWYPTNSLEEVKFGHFVSTYSEKEQAVAFGNDTVFTISSCYGVQVEKFSQFPQEKAVLVPNYEIFSVHEGEVNEFALISTKRTCSKFNCALIRGEGSQLKPGECAPDSRATLMISDSAMRDLPFNLLYIAVSFLLGARHLLLISL